MNGAVISAYDVATCGFKEVKLKSANVVVRLLKAILHHYGFNLATFDDHLTVRERRPLVVHSLDSLMFKLYNL